MRTIEDCRVIHSNVCALGIEIFELMGRELADVTVIKEVFLEQRIVSGRRITIVQRVNVIHKVLEHGVAGGVIHNAVVEVGVQTGGVTSVDRVTTNVEHAAA